MGKKRLQDITKKRPQLSQPDTRPARTGKSNKRKKAQPEFPNPERYRTGQTATKRASYRKAERRQPERPNRPKKTSAPLHPCTSALLHLCITVPKREQMYPFGLTQKGTNVPFWIDPKGNKCTPLTHANSPDPVDISRHCNPTCPTKKKNQTRFL